MRAFGALCITASLFVIASGDGTTTTATNTESSDGSSVLPDQMTTAKYDFSKSKLKDLLATIINDCQEAHKVTSEQIKNLMNQEVPKTEIEKCFMTCVYAAFKIIDNDKYNEQGLKTLAQLRFASSKEELTKANTMIETCAKEVTLKDPNERCGLGRVIRECFVQAGSKVNFFPKI